MGMLFGPTFSSVSFTIIPFMGNDASGNTISLEPDTNQVTAAHLMILLLVTYVCPNL